MWMEHPVVPLYIPSTPKRIAARNLLSLFWKTSCLWLGKLGLCSSQGTFPPCTRFQKNWHTEWQFKIKLKAKSNCIHWVQLHACFHSGCRMRPHSDSLGTNSQWTITQPEELEELPPVSWAGPASSPHWELKLLVVLSECWFLASSAEEIPVDVFCLATEADASEDRNAQLKGGHLLNCFSSPAPKWCEC